jgi:hypothetical protein
MPLLALGSNGELYEESSINDHGGGVGKLTTFADEGSVVFGAVDARSNYNRRVHRARMKKLAQMKRIQAQKIAAAKRAREQAEKIRKAKINKALKQKQARIDKKKAILFNKARKQRNFGYEYNDLMGDIFEGFENNGTVISGNCPYYGSDFDRVEAFGSNTILGSYHGYGQYDQGLGFKWKAPKIKIKAPKITMPKNLKAAIKDVGKIGAKIVTAPIALSHKAMTSVPGLRDVYKGVDKLTGGTLTSIKNVNNLLNKAAAGKRIGKAELMEAAMMVLKVGAIVASGGSAASLVSAGAGMLKGGPLGKSALGKNLLSLAEVGGAAAALYQASAAKAAEQAAKTGSKQLAQQATKEVSKEVAKKTMQESVQQAVKGKAMDMAKQKALAEVQKKTGIPVGLAMAAYDVSKAEVTIAEKTKLYATKIGEEKLKKAGLGGAATQAILAGNAQALGVMIKDVPNMAMSKAQREAEALKIKIKNQASLDGLKAKIDSRIAKAKKDVTNIESLKDRAEKETNETIKKQLDMQVAKLLKDSLKNEEEIREIGTQYQIEAARTSLKVAAAEEGRFTADMDKSFKHPIIEIHKKWAGVA